MEQAIARSRQDFEAAIQKISEIKSSITTGTPEESAFVWALSFAQGNAKKRPSAVECALLVKWGFAVQENGENFSFVASFFNALQEGIKEKGSAEATPAASSSTQLVIPECVIPDAALIETRAHIRRIYESIFPNTQLYLALIEAINGAKKKEFYFSANNINTTILNEWDLLEACPDKPAIFRLKAVVQTILATEYSVEQAGPSCYASHAKTQFIIPGVRKPKANTTHATDSTTQEAV